MLPGRNPRYFRSIPLNYLQPPNEQKAEFIDICYGNGKPHHSLDSGLKIVEDIVEKRMLDCENSMTGLLNTLWASNPGLTSYLERQFRTTTKIVHLIKSSTEQLSIDDIMTQLYDHFHVSTADRKDHKNEMRNLIFAAIGWSTMLYTAAFKATHINLSVATEIQLTDILERQPVTLVQHSCERPLGAMLHS
ncbi:hypothetical protein F5B19DRAFT_474028 [Rostrohypoxylon terebratum]|nr:hypothetical protein F5B19DRAFT_474028 [Rostrohypoxylon terebratum]